MKNLSILEFIKKSIEEKQRKSQIKEKLTAVGWTDDEVETVYSQALKELGVPIPETRLSLTSKRMGTALEVALNVFSFILLGISITAIGVLYYEIIDAYFPDPMLLSYSSSGYGSFVNTEAVHYSIAALIIACPFFFFASRLWFRRFRQEEVKIETAFTKGITYLVLLVCSVVLVGDLIAILFTFFQGEMSIRFFLKALVVFALAGTVFGWYFFERREIQYKKIVPKKVFLNFLGGASTFIVVGVIFGFLIAGSPQIARMRAFDDQRSQQLSDLASCINNFAFEYQRLPRDFKELQKSTYSYCAENISDPETRAPYSYRIIMESKTVGMTREGEFELCAEFSLDSSQGNDALYLPNDSKWWTHKAGKECYEITSVLSKNDGDK